MNNRVIHIDLFSGAGGFHEGLIRAGFKFTHHFYSEIDKHAIANYRYNYPDAEYIGSVTNVRHIVRTISRKPEDRVILTFGSPCQDFSPVGRRSGLEGSKSSLIKFALFLIRWIRPDVYIWENVKGAYSTNSGADYWAIIQAFANIDGYRFEQQLLNTSWVLPQNRERIYLIGHLAGRSRPGVFPIGESYGKTGKVKQQPDYAITNCSEKEFNWQFDKSPCLNARDYKEPKIVVSLNSNTSKGFEIANEGDSINFSNPNSKTRRGRVGKGVAQTLDTQSNQGIIVKVAHIQRTDEAKEIRKKSIQNGKDYTPFQGKKLEFIENDTMNTVTCATQKDNLISIQSNIRRLTEIEYERLQGFRDIEKYCTFEVWESYSEYQKYYANAETKNHKWQSFVGNVEKKDFIGNVLNVEPSLNTNNQQIKKPVQEVVHINCEEKKVEIRNQQKLLLYANNAETQGMSAHRVSMDDFVQHLVHINTIAEQIMLDGKEGFQVSERLLIHRKNGSIVLSMFGNEIMQRADDVGLGTIILGKHTKSTILNHLNLKNIEQTLITSFSCVMNAIDGCIREKISSPNILIETSIKYGWTKFGIYETKSGLGTKTIPKTQRYKLMGNAVTCDIILLIANRIQLI